jgi:thiosulfate/3-mercaptopyruvate sulfurtransferase
MSQLKFTAGGNIRMLGVILFAMAILCTSASSELSAYDWIKEKISGVFPSNSNTDKDVSGVSRESLEVKSATTGSSSQSESSISNDMLVSASGVDKNDIILDASDNSTSYISGAIHISYLNFIDNNNTALLKTIPEVAKILGDAGIARSDSVVVYGECPPCGGGSSVATYVYWLLRYIGHDKVRVLDGGIDAWTEAGLPVQNSSSARPTTTYSPVLRPELFATYDYVKSGAAQVVDARSVPEFESGSIPGAINIPYDQVLNGKRLKDKAGIDDVFRNLTSDKPVVVFTTTGTKASLEWFSLTMTGHVAKMYTWRDWIKGNRTG